MMKTILYKALFLVVTAIIFCDIYLSLSPSYYQEACRKLGITQKKQQIAILNIFNMAGYFQPDILRTAIYQSHVFEDPAFVFNQTSCLLDAYKANSDHFQSSVVVRRLFNRLKLWLDEDVDKKTKAIAEFILYTAQTAFDRKINQERYELTDQTWMHQHKDAYLKNARDLDLTQSVWPDIGRVYDGVLVLGGARRGVYGRLNECNYYAKLKLQTKWTFILTGQRELWAEIDGIQSNDLAALRYIRHNNLSMDTMIYAVRSPSEKLAEGKQYLLNLAKRQDIAYHIDQPFLFKNNRTYLNVIDPKDKLTETMMAHDLLRKFGSMDSIVVDSGLKKDGCRPDTLLTAQDAAHQFIDTIVAQYPMQSDFHILSISNNPYIRRQATGIQHAFNQVFKRRHLLDKKITVHGAGFKTKADISIVHSELGALISELFKKAYPDTDIKHLLFQTRQKP